MDQKESLFDWECALKRNLDETLAKAVALNEVIPPMHVSKSLELAFAPNTLLSHRLHNTKLLGILISKCPDSNSVAAVVNRLYDSCKDPVSQSCLFNLYTNKFMPFASSPSS